MPTPLSFSLVSTTKPNNHLLFPSRLLQRITCLTQMDLFLRLPYWFFFSFTRHIINYDNTNDSNDSSYNIIFIRGNSFKKPSP